MIARLIHTIQPLLPFAQSSVGPGAHPRDLASGERIPYPTTAPNSIEKVVWGPMMIPCPTYAGEKFTVQSHSLARYEPNSGTLFNGIKYETKVCSNGQIIQKI